MPSKKGNKNRLKVTSQPSNYDDDDDDDELRLPICGCMELHSPGWSCALFVFQVMGVVGPSSVADGLPLLHLSPYLSPPLPFSTAVVRLVALQIQV